MNVYVRRRWPGGATVALAWLVLAVGALAFTLQSLRHHDFNGLNNMLQIPLALPWFLIPIGSTKHVFNAWLDAGFGILNAPLIYHLWPRMRGVPGGGSS